MILLIVVGCIVNVSRARAVASIIAASDRRHNAFHHGDMSTVQMNNMNNIAVMQATGAFGPNPAVPPPAYSPPSGGMGPSPC